MKHPEPRHLKKKPKPQDTIPPGVSKVRLCLRVLRSSIRGERRRALLGLLFMLATSAAHLLTPWPMKLILDGVLGAHAPPPALRRVTDLLVPGPATPAAVLTVLCLWMLANHLLAGLLNVTSTYLLISVGLRMVNRLRSAVFDHVQRLSLRFHDATTVGDSLYRITWDTYCVQTIFNNCLIPSVGSAATFIGIAVIMSARDPLVTAAAVGVMVPLTLLIRRFERPMTESSMRVHERESDISTRVQETLTGIRAVQAFGREDLESTRFRRDSDESLRAKLRLNVMETASGALVSLLLAAGTAAVVWLTAWRVLQGRLTPGDVVLLVAYVGMLYKPLSNAAKTAATLQGAAARAWRVTSLLDATPDVRDLPHARPLPGGRARGHVALEDVSFAYRPGRPVLCGVTADIPAGTTVALVGASGAGKTTLAGMLLRFYDPLRGRVTLDGHDLRDLTLRSLRGNVALVLQDPVLFAASVRENIAYGRPDATAGEVRAAAEAAGAHEFIAALEDGYDSRIGERGVNLSGGQKQRISIARAFLQDAPVLVMDEPTSALDAQTEARLLEALDRLKAGRTTVIIAHRLSTIRNADQILVMEKGRVVEAGAHDDLLRCDGPYARLYRAQFGGRPGAADGAAPAGEAPAGEAPAVPLAGGVLQ